MRGKKYKKAKNMQHLIRSVAFICAVCFIVVSVLSAALLMTHAGHEHELINRGSRCQRTLMPECRCENSIMQAQMQIQVFQHNELHNDCFVCTFAHKTINQVRQILIVTGNIANVDVSLFALMVLSLLIMLSGVYTPVKLKTKIIN